MSLPVRTPQPRLAALSRYPLTNPRAASSGTSGEPRRPRSRRHPSAARPAGSNSPAEPARAHSYTHTSFAMPPDRTGKRRTPPVSSTPAGRPLGGRSARRRSGTGQGRVSRRGGTAVNSRGGCRTQSVEPIRLVVATNEKSSERTPYQLSPQRLVRSRTNRPAGLRLRSVLRA